MISACGGLAGTLLRFATLQCVPLAANCPCWRCWQLFSDLRFSSSPSSSLVTSCFCVRLDLGCGRCHSMCQRLVLPASRRRLAAFCGLLGTRTTGTSTVATSVCGSQRSVDGTLRRRNLLPSTRGSHTACRRELAPGENFHPQGSEANCPPNMQLAAPKST